MKKLCLLLSLMLLLTIPTSAFAKEYETADVIFGAEPYMIAESYIRRLHYQDGRNPHTDPDRKINILYAPIGENREIMDEHLRKYNDGYYGYSYDEEQLEDYINYGIVTDFNKDGFVRTGTKLTIKEFSEEYNYYATIVVAGDIAGGEDIEHGDGTVDITDLVLLRSYIVNNRIDDLNENHYIAFKACDLNNDEGIDILDVTYLRRMIIHSAKTPGEIF